MLDWLIGHALSALYSLLTKTVLKPMIWSGQQIRCAREDIRAADIRLHNAQMQLPGATPTELFFQYRRKQLWIISLHASFWLLLLCASSLYFGGAGFFAAVLAAVLVIVGYFHVDVHGIPSRIQPERK